MSTCGGKVLASEASSACSAPQLFQYRTGLVFSQAGLNDPQMWHVKNNLKLIGQAMGKVELVVPIVKHVGPSGRASTKRLIEPLTHLPYLSITLLEEEMGEALFPKLKDLDEIWCCPTTRQSLASKSSAWVVYSASQAAGHLIARRFKLILPWVELPHTSIANKDVGKSKSKPLKGY